MEADMELEGSGWKERRIARFPCAGRLLAYALHQLAQHCMRV